MMTREEFRKLDYVKLAYEISEDITIRTYNDFGSHDEKRKATKVESSIIYKIIFAAFQTYGYGDSMDIYTIANMAEFMLMNFIPEANTYDTIYIPIMKVVREWR